MKKYSIGKKELIVTDKGELREFRYELGWRLDACKDLSCVLHSKYKDDEMGRDILRMYEMLIDCLDILEKNKRETL